MMRLEPMPEFHRPGWIVTVDLGPRRSAEFQLWAPRADPPRTGWAAAWDLWENDDDGNVVSGGSDRGDIASGDTMDEALAVLERHPNPDWAASARRLLSGAARGDDQVTGPEGEPHG
jgi:hypothetical protein